MQLKGLAPSCSERTGDHVKRALQVEVPEKASAIQSLLSPCMCILDLGCGDGAYLPVLASKAEDVIGLDISEERCKTAQRRGFHIIVGDALHLPIKTYIEIILDCFSPSLFSEDA